LHTLRLSRRRSTVSAPATIDTPFTRRLLLWGTKAGCAHASLTDLARPATGRHRMHIADTPPQTVRMSPRARRGYTPPGRSAPLAVRRAVSATTWCGAILSLGLLDFAMDAEGTASTRESKCTQFLTLSAWVMLASGNVGHMCRAVNACHILEVPGRLHRLPARAQSPIGPNCCGCQRR